MDLSLLDHLTPDQVRSLLPGFLSGYITDGEARERNLARLTEFMSSWSDETCEALVAGLAACGQSLEPYPALPVGRELTRLYATDVVLRPEVHGIEHLKAAMETGPTLILANHLSYFDATATDAILARVGHADIANRIYFAAGPKVYTDLFRRVAAACLNTLPVPQSTSFAHTEKMSVRELARRAMASMKGAGAMTEAGDVLLIFPEGSRSRSNHMGSFLKGVHRYLGIAPAMNVVPMSIVGTEVVMSVENADHLVPDQVQLTFGAAAQVGRDGSTREVLADMHGRIAQLLPASLSPYADTPAVG